LGRLYYCKILTFPILFTKNISNFVVMNPKSLQQQYLNSLTPKSERPREMTNYITSAAYIQHVKNQAELITRLLDEKQGNYYIEDAFRHLKKPNG
jgi:hypothetical protein